MTILHQMVPMFFLIQFVVVLVGLAAAMLWVDPQFVLPACKTSCRAVRIVTSTYD